MNKQAGTVENSTSSSLGFCGLKVYRELKSIEGFQYSMGAVQCCKALFINGSTSSKMEERRGLLSSKGTVMLTDNACPHSAAPAIETLERSAF